VEAQLNTGAAPDSRPGLPKWVYAGVAALVLILILMSIARRRNSEPENVAAAASPAPRIELPAQPVPVETGRPPRATGRKQNGWWVIAAAYSSRDAAEKRMQSIRQRWPGFQVTVLHPQSDPAHYYVTLGEDLAEDQAEALRKRAVESGLPRDTYIKRVM
jgi:hypothetical protein